MTEQEVKRNIKLPFVVGMVCFVLALASEVIFGASFITILFMGLTAGCCLWVLGYGSPIGTPSMSGIE